MKKPKLQTPDAKVIQLRAQIRDLRTAWDAIDKWWPIEILRRDNPKHPIVAMDDLIKKFAKKR